MKRACCWIYFQGGYTQWTWKNGSKSYRRNTRVSWERAGK